MAGTMPRPYCFVLMPFGPKRDASGATIDCDAVYRDLIHSAIEAADLEPIRADEERVGGVIHKPMYERLLFCPYAVADLTTANANVFYEFGVRHAVRPGRTVTLASSATQLPFDVNHLRSLMYSLSPSGVPADPAAARDALTARLRTAREGATDSPLFQLVEGWRPAPLDHTKTDVFREQVDYSVEMKRPLAKARADGVDAIQAVEATLPSAAPAARPAAFSGGSTRTAGRPPCVRTIGCWPTVPWVKPSRPTVRGSSPTGETPIPV